MTSILKLIVFLTLFLKCSIGLNSGGNLLSLLSATQSVEGLASSVQSNVSVPSCECVHFTGTSNNLLKDPTFCYVSRFGNHPMYKSKTEKYLFFDTGDSSWNIDSSPPQGQIQVDAYVKDNADFPEDIKKPWMVGGEYGFSAGVENYKMKVHCGKWKNPLPAWAIGVITAAIFTILLVVVIWIRVRRIRRLRNMGGVSVPYRIVA